MHSVYFMPTISSSNSPLATQHHEPSSSTNYAHRKILLGLTRQQQTLSAIDSCEQGNNYNFRYLHGMDRERMKYLFSWKSS